MSILLAACLILAVHDGDTLTVDCRPHRVKPMVIRVAEIDAPEYPAFTWGMQPGAQAARAEAVKVCPVGSAADVRLDKYDSRTKRWIAHVECGEVDLSNDLVALGLAWSYLPMKKSDVPALMKAAQDQRVNLWAPGNVATPPTVWRRLGLHQCADGSAKPKC